MQKGAAEVRIRPCGSFFSYFTVIFNILLFYCYAYQSVSDNPTDTSLLFPALSIVHANVKKPASLLLFFWFN